LEDHKIASRDSRYSGCFALEDVWDDSTDLTRPDEVEQFSLASGSLTVGKLVLQAPDAGRETIDPEYRQPICGGHQRSQGADKPAECQTPTLKWK